MAAGRPGIKLFSEAEGKGGTVFQAENAGGGIVEILWKGEVTGSLSGATGENAETGKLVSSLNLTYSENQGIQKYKGFTEGPEEGLLGQLEAVWAERRADADAVQAVLEPACAPGGQILAFCGAPGRRTAH